MRFVYLLQAVERSLFTPYSHNLWEEPFSASLYFLEHNYFFEHYSPHETNLTKKAEQLLSEQNAALREQIALCRPRPRGAWLSGVHFIHLSRTSAHSS